MSKLVLAFLLTCLTMTSAGCYCFQAAHKDELKCQIVQAEVDCLKKSIVDLLPTLGSIIVWALTGGSESMDWDAALASLESEAGSAVVCGGGALVDILTTQAAVALAKGPGASPSEMHLIALSNKAKVNFGGYMAKHHKDMKLLHVHELAVAAAGSFTLPTL